MLQRSFVDEPMIYKQTKNRNETGSNLSLGTLLTVLSKRLRRKRCCEVKPDRFLEVCRRLLAKIEGFGGIPGPEAYQIKNDYAQR